MQVLIVACIVVASTAYAVWSLMPTAWRRKTAGALLALPWPEAIAARLRRHASAAASGCACDGCDAGSPKGAKATTTAPAATPQPIRFHPRPPR